MKRLLGFLTVVVLVLFSISPTFAQSTERNNLRADELVSFGSDKVVNKDFFGVGGRVEVSGTVNGDVYAFGGEIVVDGNVNGDLIVAGGTVSISGTVSQDARIAGGQVTISGRINGKTTITGGNVDVVNSASLAGSLVVAGGNVTLASPVGGSITGGLGRLTISSTVNGSVDVSVGELRLTSKAVINGDLNYWSEEEASIDDTAQVTGSTSKHKPAFSEKEREQIFAAFSGFSLFLKIASFISSLLLGLLLIKFLPRFTNSVVENIKTKSLATLGLGFLALIGGFVGSILLFITVLGIPLAIISLSLYFSALYVSRIFTAIFIGQFILSSLNKKVAVGWSLLLGLLVYMIIQGIPILGGLVTLFVILFGFGSALLTIRDSYRAAKK